ncbi:putative uncharacterized protein DDB_G0271982 [Saccostrea cucullata]|uniref:putative uncharacterized protein DDB_G0271982 n=1 Tax=Saccostrea cuccullata TaxID=36930 RepID=UPI002ED21D29
MDLLHSLPPTSVLNETAFNQMKLLKTDRRQRLSHKHLNDCLMIKLQSPAISEFDPKEAVDRWMLSPTGQKRRFGYQRKRAQQEEKERQTERENEREDERENERENEIDNEGEDETENEREDERENKRVRDVNSEREIESEESECYSESEESDYEQDEVENEREIRKLVLEMEVEIN